MKGYTSIYNKGQRGIENLSFSTNTTYGKKGNATKNRINYSTFGATLAGRSYTAPNTNYRFKGAGGQETDDEIFPGAYTAEYWEYDSRLGRRWNVDPKPNPSISNYACFNNNPILFVDVRGDTTSLYDKLGNSLGTINDNLANQTHFLNSKADYDKIMAANKGKSNNDMANAVRASSIAFYDANTEKQMKSAFEKSPNSEIFFAMVFKSSVSKQLTLEICKSCVAINGGADDNFIQGFRTEDVTDFVKATEGKNFNVFLTGHSHFKNVGKSHPEIPSSLSYKNTYTTWGTGKTVFEVANSVDYTMYLKQPHPLILLSTKGITTYRGYKVGEIIPSDEYGNINFDRGTTKKW